MTCDSCDDDDDEVLLVVYRFDLLLYLFRF